MNNDAFMALPEDLRKVVVDGFAELQQQATFASPKRKSIPAYEEFRAAGGDIYVPTPEEMDAFAEAASPIYDWFNENVEGGEEVLTTLREDVANAEAKIDEEYAAELN